MGSNPTLFNFLPPPLFSFSQSIVDTTPFTVLIRKGDKELVVYILNRSVFLRSKLLVAQ